MRTIPDSHTQKQGVLVAGVWCTNLLLMILMSYFDEGLNSFRFLSDPSSLVFIFLAATILTGIVCLVFFAVPNRTDFIIDFKFVAITQLIVSSLILIFLFF